MTVVANDSTPDFGDVVQLTISGHSEAPNAVTVNGVSESLGGPPVSSYAEVTIPPGIDFVADGDHQYTPLGADILVTLSFPTEADDSVTIQITPGSPYTLTTAAAPPYPSGHSHAAGTAEGDVYLWKVTSGVLDSIGTDGVVVADTLPLVLERYRFPAALEMWSAKDTLTYDTNVYPTLPVQARIVPDVEGVITRRTSGGTLRSVDLNQANTYRITLTHPLLTAAERDQLLTFYDANRDNAFSLTPLTDAYSYSCLFESEPARSSRNSVYFDVTVQLRGVRI